MSRLLVLIALMLSMGSAYAEWTLIGKNDADMAVYIDLATIRPSGNLVKVWVLQDQKIKKTGFVSAKGQWQINCQEEQFRLLASSFFSKHMGQGDVVASDSNPDKWMPVEPVSFSEDIYKIVCGKK